MKCVMCKEDIADTDTQCSFCGSHAQKIKGNLSYSTDLAAVIEALPVSESQKKNFRLIQENNLFNGSSSIDGPKMKQAKLSFRDRFRVRGSILAFLFTIFYYFFTGMWRKGLVLFGFTVVLFFVEDFFAHEAVSRGIWMGMSVLCSMMAVMDQYRTKVLKQTFWF